MTPAYLMLVFISNKVWYSQVIMKDIIYFILLCTLGRVEMPILGELMSSCTVHNFNIVVTIRIRTALAFPANEDK